MKKFIASIILFMAATAVMAQKDIYSFKIKDSKGAEIRIVRSILADGLIGHGAHARVGPYVLGSLDHINDGVDGKYYSQNSHGSTYSGHK